jgi:HlyD family secretion protein
VSSEAPKDLSGLRIDRDAPPAETSTNRRIVVLAVAALVLVALAFAGWRATHPSSLPVVVARAESLGGSPGANATEILTANGYVVARQRASVSTEVSGRLNRLLVEEGSRVVKGQVLGILQNADQRSALESARAALASAQAREAETAADATQTSLARGRSEQLKTRGLVSQSELDQAVATDDAAKARVQSAKAEVLNARARVTSAQVDYDRTFVRAPFSGAVLRKEADVGEIVSPVPSSGGLTRGAIVTMANLESLEAEADVNEGYVARVHEGMRAEIVLDAYCNDRFPAHVRQIVPTADRQKATVLVKVAFDKLDPRVLPEMGLKVTFLADPTQDASASGPPVVAAVAIPKQAVRDFEGRAVVYVVEDGRASMRGISPRPLGPDRVIVSGGLAPGEMVIVEAPAGLSDKSRVRVK